MHVVKKREKEILECLFNGLSDKSHCQKTWHQLQDGQRPSAQPVRQTWRKKQRPSHLPDASGGKRHHHGTSRPYPS